MARVTPEGEHRIERSKIDKRAEELIRYYDLKTPFMERAREALKIGLKEGIHLALVELRGIGKEKRNLKEGDKLRQLSFEIDKRLSQPSK